jgi:hypothetical protein
MVPGLWASLTADDIGTCRRRNTPQCKFLPANGICGNLIESGRSLNNPATPHVSKSSFACSFDTYSLLTGSAISEQLLSDQSQQPHHERDDGDPGVNANARQAAEALFAPKRQLPARSSREMPPGADPGRRPRVLLASSTILDPTPKRLAAPIIPVEQVTPRIPKSQFSRIRAWRRYGMTARQVAKVYKVSVEEIERIVSVG